MEKIKNLSTKGKLYLVSYLFAFLYSFLPATMISDVLVPSGIGKILILISILVMFTKVVLFDSFTLKELIIYSLLFIIITISGLKTDSFVFLIFIVMFIGSRNMDSKLIIQASFMFLLVSLTITIVLSLLGVIPNLTYVRFAGDTHVRHSLGTSYPTVLGSFIFFLSLQYTYLKQKLTCKDFIALICLTGIVHYLTDNRLVVMLLILLIVVEWVALSESITKLIDNLSIKYGWMILYFIPIAIILFLSLTYNESPLYQWIDTLLSGRIQISHKGFTEYGLSLLGKILPIVGYGRVGAGQVENYFYLDILSVDIILREGLLIFIIFLLYNFKAIKTALWKKDIQLAIILTLIILYGIIDNKSVRIAYNPFPLVVATMLNIEKKSEGILINKDYLLAIIKRENQQRKK